MTEPILCNVDSTADPDFYSSLSLNLNLDLNLSLWSARVR